MSLKQIIIISNSKLLGDNVIISGNIVAIKKHFPKHIIYVICQEQIISLFQMMDVIPIPFNLENFKQHEEIPREIKFLDFEYVINYNYSFGSYSFIKKLIHSTRIKDVLLSFIKTKRRIRIYGFETYEINKDLCNEIYTKYIGLEDWNNEVRNLPAHQTLGRVLKLIDAAIDPQLPQLKVPEISIIEVKRILAAQNVKQPFVCFCPGAGSLVKRWSLANFIKIAEKLVLQYSCIFVFGPEESELQKEFEVQFIHKGLRVLFGLTIPQLAALFSLAKLNITNDSGPMHVSCAVECPTIALFGSTNSKGWFPYNKVKNRIIEKECSSYENCNGCNKEDYCIHELKVDYVFNNVNSILSY